MGTKLAKSFVISCALVAVLADHTASASRPFGIHSPASFVLRGGESTTSDAPTTEETSLDDKVNAAMKKLGIGSTVADGDDECKDGVCPMPDQASGKEINPNDLADEIAKDMSVDSSLAMAAIGATSTFGGNNQRIYNEKAARDMIQYELDLIANIPADCKEVQQLVEEGFDSFLSRRALAFAENNMDNARAILIADQMDEEEEKEAAKRAQEEEEDEEAAIRAQLRAEQAGKKLDIVEVKADFDPTTLPHKPAATPQQAQAPSQGMPKPAAKESVVFEATTAQIQELVLESPVPVLLDVYADWCGPCKVLSPALEEMAVKSGGAFRLVKVNSDNEKPVSAALEVTALPTVYGVRDGKIVHMFEGMPKSEEMMKNFMMGLFGAAPFQPAVTAEQSAKYEELTEKLIKTASAASFSFSARERLTDRLTTRLDELVQSDSIDDVEGAARLLRTLFNNLVRNPMDSKFRTINLENNVIASKIGNNPTCLAIMKSVGFSKSGSEMVVAKGKKIINVAPLMVARDTIDHWIQKNQREMAAAARRRKDELDRAKLQAEREAAGPEESDEEEEMEEVDQTACKLKLRLDGKKRVHDVTLHENDPLSNILDALDIDSSEEEAQITCVAKRLVIKSSDSEAMQKTLRQHGLMPSAAIVVKVGAGSPAAESSTLKERAAKKSRKKGSHTMQSIGVYAKDDNNKAELIDGGGGVWYEQDVSDDEEEPERADDTQEDSTGEDVGEDQEED
jgi:thioredoxin